MLLLFKRNDFTTFFILVFFTFVVRAVYFIEVPQVEDLGAFYRTTFFSWDGLLHFYNWSPRLYLFLSTLLWIVFAAYFKFVIVSEKLINKKSFVPAMSFILFASALPYFVVFSVQALSALLLFIAFAQAIRTQYNLKSSAHYFIVGTLIGLAAFFTGQVPFYFSCFLDITHLAHFCGSRIYIAYYWFYPTVVFIH